MVWSQILSCCSDGPIERHSRMPVREELECRSYILTSRNISTRHEEVGFSLQHITRFVQRNAIRHSHILVYLLGLPLIRDLF